ncbi:FAD-binding oxidoreductase [Actinophytocola sp. NPDC049390]|uniref:FAD-binding oxidoreductase n=1 Tax=Actinophytocola sp. NPDC049390 TaxID=3363894 RepID=UPI0037B7A6EE
MLDLVHPGDDRYDLSRNQFIGRPDETLPRAVARCAGPAHVVEALAVARQRDWPFAIRGGGHSNACHSASDGLVLDLTPADSITVDGTRVTVGAGVRVGQLAAALAPGERLVPAGSCPSVGLVGTALGGGFGAHGRLHGLTCDRLLSAEVVLADGQVVHVDADHEPDLFWALRGAGGGNFGVVTAATFATAPSTPRTHVRHIWDLTAAPALLRHWLEWTPPDDVSVELVLVCGDQLDEDPEVMLVGTLADPADLADLLDRAGEPRRSDVTRLGAADAALLHATPASAVAHDPVAIPLTQHRPGMMSAKTEFFARALPAHAIADLVTHFAADRVFGEFRQVAFTPWRGAYGRVRPEDTAFVHRDADYLVKHTVILGPNGAARRGGEALDWLARSWQVIHPWGTGGAYPNFPDPALTDWMTAYHGANADRLRTVKEKYDPDGFFRFAQSIR